MEQQRTINTPRVTDRPSGTGSVRAEESAASRLARPDTIQDAKARARVGTTEDRLLSAIDRLEVLLQDARNDLILWRTRAIVAEQQIEAASSPGLLAPRWWARPLSWVRAVRMPAPPSPPQVWPTRMPQTAEAAVLEALGAEWMASDALAARLQIRGATAYARLRRMEIRGIVESRSAPRGARSTNGRVREYRVRCADAP